AIRSRCVEIFFKALEKEDIIKIANNAAKKVGFKISEVGLNIIAKYCSNGREVVNLIQLCTGLAINDNREQITDEDIRWVIENGQYSPRMDNFIYQHPEIGVVNGLAVYGSNMGALMEIEATAQKISKRKGILKITGIVEDEEITSSNKKIKRKSTAYCSVQNVLTVLNNIFNMNCEWYDIHVNFPGGMPVDGPSAGISITTAIYSAINKIPVNNKIAMTGEISLKGNVKPIGGVNAKIIAAKKAGAEVVLIPKDNWNKGFECIEGIKVVPVKSIKEVLNISMLRNPKAVSNDNIEIIVAKSCK
ncbi:MAG: S16 family serine protease, partial [Sarcina sp.]